MRLIIAEKPSLGEAIADGIEGVKEKKKGHIIVGDDTTIVWAFGHMIQLKDPEDYDKKYSKWNLDHLPISFPNWEKKRKTIKVLKNESKDQKEKRELMQKGLDYQLDLILKFIKEADEIINAGDPDDEGQLLIDELIEFANVKTKVKRLIINDNSLDAVKKALLNIEDNNKYIKNGISANARAMADITLGINCTRFFSIINNSFLRVGRVQTPTLGLIYNRDASIKMHKKENYYELESTFTVDKLSNKDNTELEKLKILYKNEFVNEEKREKLLLNISQKFEEISKAEFLDFKYFYKEVPKGQFEDKEILENTINFIAENKKQILQINKKIEKELAPLPFNLLKLQVYANNKWGYTAQETLDTTQKLRENFKAITYNRSDCQYLTEEHLKEAPELLKSIQKNLGIFIPGLNIENILPPKCFDNSKVTAHHGIIPTNIILDINKLSEKEKNIYLCITNFYVIQFLPPIIKEKTEGLIEIADDCYFKNNSTKILDFGYKNFLNEKLEEDHEIKEDILSNYYPGNYQIEYSESKIDTFETKPKKPYTEGTLLQDMSSISKYATDPEIKKILKEKDKDKKGENGGIGTPATRANIIEGLFNSKYIEKKGKNIICTDLGKEFFNSLPVELQTADLTAKWFLIQEEIKKGESEPLKLITEVVESVSTIISKKYNKVSLNSTERDIISICPKCGKNIYENEKSFYCEGYKDDPKCNFAIWKVKKLFGVEKKINTKDFLSLVGKKPTLFKNFTNKTGKKYNAFFIYDVESNSLKFDSFEKTVKK